MKRQEILEIIVSNPQAIFSNANREAGKYSDYPALFQVTRMSYDKSMVIIKAVNVHIQDHVLTEKGDWARGEDGWIMDTRPVAERTYITYGSERSMPTRLVLKTEKSEASMLAEKIANEEESIRARAERNAREQLNIERIDELKTVLLSLGLLDESKVERFGWYGYVQLDLRDEKIELLTSALKSALVEVGV
jgi:hypothetical protein